MFLSYSKQQKYRKNKTKAGKNNERPLSQPALWPTFIFVSFDLLIRFVAISKKSSLNFSAFYFTVYCWLFSVAHFFHFHLNWPVYLTSFCVAISKL